MHIGEAPCRAENYNIGSEIVLSDPLPTIEDPKIQGLTHVTFCAFAFFFRRAAVLNRGSRWFSPAPRKIGEQRSGIAGLTGKLPADPKLRGRIRKGPWRIRKCNFGSEFAFSDSLVAAQSGGPADPKMQFRIRNCIFGSARGIFGSEIAFSDPSVAALVS